MRLFPVLLGAGSYGCKVYVPWSLVAPHEQQADRNHGQSLQRLADRGGLCPSELAAVLEDRAWHRMEDRDAWAVIYTQFAASVIAARPQ